MTPTSDQDFDQQPQPARTTNFLLGAIVVLLVAIGAVLVFTLFGDQGESPGLAGATTTTTNADSTSTSSSDDTTSTTAEGDSTTTTEADTTTTTEPTTTTTIELDADELAAAEAVTTWIAALGEGDADAAWALVGPASQEIVGGRSGFDEIFSGLVEGFGAWASATDPNGQNTPWVYVNSVDDQLVVVTLAGQVTQEGTTTVRAAAVPVTFTGGTAQVQPFLRVEPVVFVNPEFTEEPWPLKGQPSLSMTIGGAPSVFVFLGSEEVSSTTSFDDGVSTIVTEKLNGLEAGGQYVLTILVLDEGVIHSDAVMVVATEAS